MQKLIVTTALFIALLTTSAFTVMNGNGKVIMTVSIEVKNYSEWKKAFDAGAPVRKNAGINVLYICRSSENESQVLVIEEAPSLDSAKTFLDILKSKQKSGDISKLEVKLYNQD